MGTPKPTIKWIIRAVDGVSKCCAVKNTVYRTRGRMCRRCRIRVFALLKIFNKIKKRKGFK